MVNPRNRNNIQWHPVLRTKPQANNFLICKNNFLISKRDQRPPFGVPELSFRYKFIPLVRSFQNARQLVNSARVICNLDTSWETYLMGQIWARDNLKKKQCLLPSQFFFPVLPRFCPVPVRCFFFFPTKQARKHLAVITWSFIYVTLCINYNMYNSIHSPF